MISEKDLERILDRYLKGIANEHEIRQVEKWYASLDKANDFPQLDESEDKHLHEKDLHQIRNKISVKGRRVHLLPTLLKVAAVIFAGLALVYFINSASHDAGRQTFFTASVPEEIINRSTEVKTILLPDSTQVSLEPNSSIIFSQDDFNIHDRQVMLEGTASFAVTHDQIRPFRVLTYDVITTVLGTTFTIEAPSSKEKITVAVHTGRVSVAQRKENTSTLERTDEIIVTPNQQVIFHPEKRKLTALLVPHPIPLHETKNSKVVFDEEPVTNILLKISQAFGVDIKYDEQTLRHCRITTAFSDEDLYERLDILTKTINATYTVEGTTIRFRSNGCATH